MATVDRVEIEPAKAAVYGYRLTLSEDEAKVLASVVGRVGGDPQGRRGNLDKLFNQLFDLGLVVDIYDPDIAGQIDFIK